MLFEAKLVFVERRNGKSKKDADWYMVKLHDPVSLDSMSCFVQKSVYDAADGMQFRDRCKCTMEVGNGQAGLRADLVGIGKDA